MTNKSRHCPAHIIIGRAIQWNTPSGVAAIFRVSMTKRDTTRANPCPGRGTRGNKITD
ncbi:hypothetical protein [Candidatus Spongiihabitans sp.]|uniref:hypothetical protein n=1 Tax=Candidatus Spongiihabitans sp. TaxID=3101308 RepID=UPI003C7DE787